MRELLASAAVNSPLGTSNEISEVIFSTAAAATTYKLGTKGKQKALIELNAATSAALRSLFRSLKAAVAEVVYDPDFFCPPIRCVNRKSRRVSAAAAAVATTTPTTTPSSSSSASEIDTVVAVVDCSSSSSSDDRKIRLAQKRKEGRRNGGGERARIGKAISPM